MVSGGGIVVVSQVVKNYDQQLQSPTQSVNHIKFIIREKYI